MMSAPKIPTLRLQQFARRLLVAGCTVLLMGVMGAAAIRVEERGEGAQVAAAAKTPALMAAVETASPAAIDEALDAQAAQAMARIERQPRTILMEVTAYCPCELCCGPNAIGITASGKHVSYNGGKFVAADTSLLPFGTKLIIPGYADGQPVEVIDRGGAIKGKKLDVYFDDHAVARLWGRRMIEVTVAD